VAQHQQQFTRAVPKSLPPLRCPLQLGDLREVAMHSIRRCFNPGLQILPLLLLLSLRALSGPRPNLFGFVRSELLALLLTLARRNRPSTGTMSSALMTAKLI
jgi:hypothetical protein